MKRLALAVPLAGLAVAGGALAAATPRTITVSGSGIITSVPNQAEFTFGVTTTALTAEGAISANAARMNRVIAALKGLGIKPANLQTAELSLNPMTNSDGTAIIGYSASNSVTATTDDVAKAGPIVDAAVRAGSNNVSGPTLTPSDQVLLDREALAAAVANARAGALAIAKAAGVRLGAIVTVSEVSNSTPPPVFAAAGVARAAAPTPIEAGTVQTEEDITATFAIG